MTKIVIYSEPIMDRKNQENRPKRVITYSNN